MAAGGDESDKSVKLSLVRYDPMHDAGDQEQPGDPENPGEVPDPGDDTEDPGDNDDSGDHAEDPRENGSCASVSSVAVCFDEPRN